MSDFYQNGIVTNLHNLRSQHPENLEKELIEFSKSGGFGFTIALFRATQASSKEHR